MKLSVRAPLCQLARFLVLAGMAIGIFRAGMVYESDGNECRLVQWFTSPARSSTDTELQEFVPDLPPRLWTGELVLADCRYSGKATAMRNYREMQCIDALFHAGDVRP